MSELRTLKDLPRYVKSKVSNGTIDYDALRTLAIKWVKDARNKDHKNWYIRCEIVIIFFNITEDELK